MREVSYAILHNDDYNKEKYTPVNWSASSDVIYTRSGMKWSDYPNWNGKYT